MRIHSRFHKDGFGITSRIMLSIAALLLCISNQVSADPISNAASRIGLPGIVRPLKSVDLALTQDGVIAEIAVAEGMEVSSGQFLLKLNDELATSQVKVREVAANRDAEQAVATAELVNAQQNFERAKRISQRNAASAVDVERAEIQVRRAEANVAIAERDAQQRRYELDLERKRLQAHQLAAPFDGVILRLHCQPGKSVKAGDALLLLVDLRRLRVTLHLPWEWRHRVPVGQEVQLTASGPVASALVARVIVSEPAIEAATGTFRCTLEISNKDLRLPSGFAVTLVEESLPRQSTGSLRAGNRVDARPTRKEHVTE